MGPFDTRIEGKVHCGRASVSLWDKRSVGRPTPLIELGRGTANYFGTPASLRINKAMHRLGGVAALLSPFDDAA